MANPNDATPPVVRPDGDPLASPAGNTAALQAVVDAAGVGEPLRVDFGPGWYTFAGPVTVPSTKVLVLDGNEVARVQMSTPGDDWIRITDGGVQWGSGRLTVQGFHEVRGNIVTHGPNVQMNRPRIRGCNFFVSYKYPVNLATGYCVQPYVGDIWFAGGGLNWTYGPNNEGVPHASSGLVLERVRVHNHHGGRPGPDIRLRGHNQPAVRNVICEGTTAGWKPGVDPDGEDVRRTVGLLVDAPGPRGGLIENYWGEFQNWSFVPDDGSGDFWRGATDVRVHNPYQGSAGAYHSGEFQLVNVYAHGPVTVSSNPLALNVPAVTVVSCSAVTATGKVITRQWLTGGLKQVTVDTGLPAVKWE